jgi:hypothetical protein
MNRTITVSTIIASLAIALGLYANERVTPTESTTNGEAAIEETPLTAEAILEKKFEGKATVEFQVGEVDTLNIDSIFMPGVSHALVIRPKIPGAKFDDEFLVLVSREIATRLLQLGIADTAEHFRGKILRVTGTVERLKRTETPSVMVYRIRVTSIDQLDNIRKP